MKKLKMLAVGGAMVLLAAMTACDTGTMGAQPGGQNPGGGGEAVTIGIKFDQPGLGQKVGDGYQGFDVEVAKYVAKELGYGPITFMEAPSPQRENLIMGGQVKMIFATYSITDARKEKISFAGPYFVAKQDFLVKSDATIASLDDLKGKKVCSVTGSTPAKTIADKYPDLQLQNFDTYSKCVEALANGSIDAVTTDDVILAGYSAQEQYKGKFKVAGLTVKPEQEKYGVGIKKGDVELCNKINTAITKMIDSGEWDKALAATAGASGYKAPAKPTLETCS